MRKSEKGDSGKVGEKPLSKGMTILKKGSVRGGEEHDGSKKKEIVGRGKKGNHGFD